MTLKLMIEPEAKDLILKKADGSFTLDVYETLSSYGPGSPTPTVTLGKPKSRQYLYAPVEMDGLTCYENCEHCFCDGCIVTTASFLNHKSLRLDQQDNHPTE